MKSQKHGGCVHEKVGAKGAPTVVTPYGMDTSDYNGGAGEMRPDMPQKASGAAGGYPSSFKSHAHKGGSRPEGAGPHKKSY